MPTLEHPERLVITEGRRSPERSDPVGGRVRSLLEVREEKKQREKKLAEQREMAAALERGKFDASPADKLLIAARKHTEAEHRRVHENYKAVMLRLDDPKDGDAELLAEAMDRMPIAQEDVEKDVAAIAEVKAAQEKVEAAEKAFKECEARDAILRKLDAKVKAKDAKMAELQKLIDELQQQLERHGTAAAVLRTSQSRLTSDKNAAPRIY